MTLNVKLRGMDEHYEISGTDDSGLIPEGMTNAMVQYEDGKPHFIFYSRKVNPETNKKWIEGEELNPGIKEEIKSHYASESDPEKIAEVLKILRGDKNEIHGGAEK